MTLHRRTWMMAVAFAAVACGGENRTLTTSSAPGASPESEAVSPVEVTPGRSLGPVAVGMRRADLVRALGDPETQFSFQRIITYRYPRHGLEVVLTSSDADEATEDALVRSVGTLPDALVVG